MNIDYVLLMSAGMGTRMGKIGTQLPKALWPIFDRSLLELQIDFWRQYSPKIIFINLHFRGDFIKREMENRLNKMDDIVLLPEPILLDSGGPIFNVKKYVDDNNLTGTNLVVANTDQLIFNIRFDDFELSDVTLLSIKVKTEDAYNRLVVRDNLLEGIVPPSANAPATTFAGIAYFNLKKCRGFVRPIKFFDGPANFHQKKVKVVLLDGPDVWDFGTKENYVFNLKKIISLIGLDKSQPILTFLSSHQALDHRRVRIQDLSYHLADGARSGEFVFNFSGFPWMLHSLVNNTIFLSTGDVSQFPQSNRIYYQELVDEI